MSIRQTFADGRQWEINQDRIYTPEEGGALEAIPGLRVTGVGRRIGARDAIAAAAKIVGDELPPPISPAQVVSTDYGNFGRDYQLDGVKQLLGILNLAGGALLCDDMGLGKTLQAILTIDTALSGGDRTLVIAPAAALETWREELLKWWGDGIAVISSRAKKAEWSAALEAPIVVTSMDYRMIQKVRQHAFQGKYPKGLIIDEAHRFRGRESLRADTLEQLAPMCRLRLAITATPQLNRPRDWWQLLHLLFGNKFGNSYTFDMRYCGGVNSLRRGTSNKGATHLDELRLRLGYYWVRREKHEVAAELPPLTRQVRWIDPDPAALNATNAYRLGVGRGALFAALAATLKGKAEEAMALAEESRRFLLLTWMRDDAEYFEQELNERGTPCVLIHGGVSLEVRALRIAQARREGMGIVGTLDALSESLNLQGIASVGIMHHIDPVALKSAQAEARLHRLGTVDPVNWYYLAMKETVDVDMVQTVVTKLDAWVRVMGKGKAEMMNQLQDSLDARNAGKSEQELMLRLYEEL